MGRVAGALFLMGTALTVIGILLPHSAEVDVMGFWWIAVGTALAGVCLLRYRSALPRGGYQAVMLVASLTVTLSIYFNGERHGGPSAGNQVLFVWVALYAGCFFSAAAMIAQLGVIAGLYGAVLLVIHPGPVALTRWLITIGMASTAAAIVHLLKRRNDELLASLTKAARTDALTGLVNRQGFDELLELALARDRRTGRSTALVLLDIDHFKLINDRLGHAARDGALRTVAATALREARSTDTIARVGGDEFAAVLPDTDSEGAFLFAERVRGAVLASQAPGIGPLTMSLGIAESQSDGLSPDVLTSSADKALYLAKELGRNQTVAAPGARGNIRSRQRRGVAALSTPG